MHALKQRGMSLVELLVGAAIGLFIVAAAAMLLSSQMSDNRRLLLETQMQQDLRVTADIVARDLRRAGHWALARSAVWQPGASAPGTNAYADLSPAGDGDSASTVLYSYSRAVAEGDEDGVVAANERFGFRLRAGVIETQLGEGNWQALTDANVLRVTRFTVTMNRQETPLGCLKDCADGTRDCWPRQQVREAEVLIAAQSTNDPAVRRSLRSNVRLRNDVVTGACPL